MNQLVVIVLLCGCIINSSGDPPEVDWDMVENYLTELQYLGMNSPDPEMQQLMLENRTDEAMTLAILTYQRTWNLTVTGEMDEGTYSMIEILRCGMPDINTMEDVPYTESVDSDVANYTEDSGAANHTQDSGPADGLASRHVRHEQRHTGRRQKRYSISGYRHKSLNISYNTLTYPTHGPENDTVDSIVAKAFRAWQDVSPLTFHRVNDTTANIIIHFYDKGHKDYKDQSYLNDIAHAFYPYVLYEGSEIHFNNIPGKKWIAGRPKHNDTEVDLYYVTLHEIGHALGMKHVLRNKRSIMHPYYQAKDDEEIILDKDEINGINRLYGEEMTAITLEEMRNQSSDMAMPMEMDSLMLKFCSVGTIDAITLRTDGDRQYIYAFQGEMYVRIMNSMVELGYPKLIRDEWRKLPNNIEAAYVNNNAQDRITFMKDGETFTYSDRKDPEIKSATESLTPRYTARDAIFVYEKSGKEYHILGNKYIVISNGKIDSKCSGNGKMYPCWRLIARFFPFLQDIPISAAFSWSRELLYIFSNTQYYVISFATKTPTLVKCAECLEHVRHCVPVFQRAGSFTVMSRPIDDDVYTNYEASYVDL